ncbi:hypothetical protein GCM10010452_32700 [Crossiella cryophila]
MATPQASRSSAGSYKPCLAGMAEKITLKTSLVVFRAQVVECWARDDGGPRGHTGVRAGSDR